MQPSCNAEGEHCPSPLPIVAFFKNLFLLYFFHYHLSPFLQLPHTVIYAHESFLLFAPSFHLLTRSHRQSCQPALSLWECRLLQPLWKAVWKYLKKLKMELLYDSAIPLLGIYLKKPKTLTQKNRSTPMFLAALFTISKKRKQPKYPSVDEWIKKLWYIYTMEYCSAIKKKKKI